MTQRQRHQGLALMTDSHRIRTAGQGRGRAVDVRETLLLTCRTFTDHDRLDSSCGPPRPESGRASG